MLGLFQIIPTPTPTPVPAQVLSEGLKAIDDSQKLIEAAGNLTALGILALAVVAVILWIVFGRGRGREVQSLINTLAKQNDDTRETFEGIVTDLRAQLLEMRQELTENKKRIEKQQEDYRLENFNRDERYLGGMSAYAEANHRIADLHEQSLKNEGTRDRILQELKIVVESMNKQGSTPVQEIKQGVDSILQKANDILQAVKNIQQPISLTSQITEINLAVSALNGVVDKLKKTDTGPIPKIEAVSTPETSS